MPSGSHLVTRRALIHRAAAAALAGSAAGATEAPSDPWPAWRGRFVSAEGAVVDQGMGDGRGGVSHSEAQGYGLLLAQATGDRDVFEGIERWLTARRAIREDALMAWRPDGSAAHWHNATDGDLCRAWALLRAATLSGWSGHLETAERVAQALEALCLAVDPRTEDEPVLLPGAEFGGARDLVPFNPSYVIPRALRELGLAFDLPRLTRAADHGETLLAELAARGPLPDWIGLGRTGYAPLPDRPATSGYDALRVPLYLCWSGRADHPAVARVAADLRGATLPGHLAVQRAPDGAVLAESDLPGYRALLDLAEGAAVGATGPAIAAQPYYPATLHMLAIVAATEGR